MNLHLEKENFNKLITLCSDYFNITNAFIEKDYYYLFFK